MATVELAEDTELGRKVAIKRLFASLAGDDALQKRFLREARMAAALSHPNLVAVYDVGEEDGQPYIVMEYVEGETLAELMAREGPIAPERAVELLVQLCAGLEYAHTAGLVHRDIKPRNLLVRHDGVVKIADFGIARTRNASQLTEVGTVLGTAAYLAPEQAAGEQVGAEADIYSLGAVAYELLSGRTPYKFESFADLTREQRRAPPPLTGVPPELERAVLRALAFDILERPESAAAFARELAPDDDKTEVTRIMPRRTGVHVSRRTQVALGAVLGVVLLALLIGGLAFGDDGGGVESPPLETTARPDVLPRGDTPEESARLLAEWLRERSG